LVGLTLIDAMGTNIPQYTIVYIVKRIVEMLMHCKLRGIGSGFSKNKIPAPVWFWFLDKKVKVSVPNDFGTGPR